MHYRNLIDLTKHLSPDTLALNDLSQAPRVDIMPVKGKVHSGLEEAFLARWCVLGGPPLAREYRFHPTRRWRLDFALPTQLIGFEVQGGLYSPNSGHRSRSGVMRDYEKHNAALLLGWRVFFVEAKAIDDARLLSTLIAYCRV